MSYAFLRTKRSRIIALITLVGLVSIALLVVILGCTVSFCDAATNVSLFNISARLIPRGAPRLAVRQGEQVTLGVSTSTAVRKLEICTEQRRLFAAYSDFVNCRPLVYTLLPGRPKVTVVIPRTMPLGRAIVITRVRGSDGKLVPASPTDEKMTLLITPYKGQSPAGATGGGDGGSGGGGSGGGGGGSGGGSGDGGGSAPQPTPSPSHSPSPTPCPPDGCSTPVPTMWF